MKENSKCVATAFPQRISYRILKIIGLAFYFFLFWLVRLFGKFSPIPHFRKQCLVPAIFCLLNTYKFKQYSESDTVHKLLHNIWTLCFTCGERYDLQCQTDRVFAWEIKVFYIIKNSQYIISIHLLSITNDLHCPSIKHLPYITYHQCIIFSDHLQYTTQLILKAVFWQFLIGSHNIWALRFIYFLYKMWCQSEVLRYEFKSFTSFKTAILFCQFNPLG